MKRWFALATLFLSFSLKSSITQQYWVALEAPNVLVRSQLAQVIHLDSIVDDRVYSVVSEDSFRELQKRYPKRILSSYPIALKPRSQQKSFDFPRGDEDYHTYLEMEALLRELHQTYPELTRLTSLGQTHGGRQIYALWVGAVQAGEQGQFIPTAAYLGAHHAREHLSVEVPLLAAKRILEESASNPRIQRLLETRRMVFIPMVNPDGAMHDIRDGRYHMWRKNHRQTRDGVEGVDLNRNYDQNWARGGSSSNPRSDVYHGPAPFSEPESRAIKEFVEQNPELRAMISFHSFGELVLYPWSGSYDPVGARDRRIFESWGRELAVSNGYRVQQSSDLYVSTGDTCDWAYEAAGVYCFTFELSPRSHGQGGFYPGASLIESAAHENFESILRLAERAADPAQESFRLESGPLF